MAEFIPMTLPLRVNVNNVVSIGAGIALDSNGYIWGWQPVVIRLDAIRVPGPGGVGYFNINAGATATVPPQPTQPQPPATSFQSDIGFELIESLPDEITELRDYVMISAGNFADFIGVWLNDNELTRDFHYTAEEASTVITVREQAFRDYGRNGENVIEIRFREPESGDIRRSVQQFRICESVDLAGIRVTVDGERVIFTDQVPVIVDGRTLVPVRGVFEHLGFDVDWQTPTATLSGGAYVIVISIGSADFTTNAAPHTLDVPAQLIGGRTMLPIRAVSESVGHSVEWDAATRTVIITTN
jgi:hypothetical protein